ncbi:hypothetical protein AB0D11_18550 [Streptomyces monashensis]
MRVLATVATAAKAVVAKAAGAHETLVTGQDGDIAGWVRTVAEGRGADVV